MLVNWLSWKYYQISSYRKVINTFQPIRFYNYSLNTTFLHTVASLPVSGDTHSKQIQTKSRGPDDPKSPNSNLHHYGQTKRALAL